MKVFTSLFAIKINCEEDEPILFFFFFFIFKSMKREEIIEMKNQIDKLDETRLKLFFVNFNNEFYKFIINYYIVE